MQGFVGAVLFRKEAGMTPGREAGDNDVGDKGKGVLYKMAAWVLTASSVCRGHVLFLFRCVPRTQEQELWWGPVKAQSEWAPGRKFKG